MRPKLSVRNPVEQWFNDLDKRPVLTGTGSILCLLIISWLAFGWNLGNVGLFDETEPLFAEASRQMLVTGDWITPFFNGHTRFDKPALIYWCQAIAYKIIGVNEWAVRLPSALAAIGLIGLSFYTVQWHLAKKEELEQVTRPTHRYFTALLSGALMALTPEMIVWGRTGVSDMLLTGCMASALLCFFLGYAQGTSSRTTQFPNQWYLACYVLIAASILTKGPVGIVLPGIVILGFLLYLGKVREVFREMHLWMGMLIILGLSAPWYVLVIWRNGWDYINSFFGYHNIERFTGVVNGHSEPWYFYFLVVLLGFAPYSIYLPLAITRLKFWQRSHWCTQERSQQLGLFAVFWFAGVFGFFTIAVTKLPSYVLPLMPAAAILVSLLWSTPIFSSFFQVSAWINVIFLTIISVAFFHMSVFVGYDPAVPNIRQLLEQSGIPTLGGITWLLCAIVIAGLLLSRRRVPVIGINLVGFMVFLAVVLMPTMFLADQQRQLPLRELSALAVQAKQPKEQLVMVGFEKPSVTFYTHERVEYLKFPQDAREYIQTQVEHKVQPPSLLLILEHKKLQQMDLAAVQYKNLGVKGAYQLIRVLFNRMETEKINIS